MSIPCYVHNAKLLFVFAQDTQTEAMKIVNYQNCLGVKISSIDPENPECFFLHTDQEFEADTKTLEEVIQQTLEDYRMIFVFLSRDLMEHQPTAALITAALQTNKVIADKSRQTRRSILASFARWPLCHCPDL